MPSAWACDVAENSQVARDLFDRAANAVLGYDLSGVAAYPDPKSVARDAVQPTGDFRDEPRALLRGCGRCDPGRLARAIRSANSAALVVARRWRSTKRCASSTSADKRCSTQPNSRTAVCRRCSVWKRRGARALSTRRARKAAARVQLANFNSPTQIVDQRRPTEAVQAAGDAMLAAGAKRVVPLNVSGAWHSELMQPAIDRFAAAVDAGVLHCRAFDVVSNVDASAYRDVASIERNLVALDRRRSPLARRGAEAACRTNSMWSSSSARATCSVR